MICSWANVKRGALQKLSQKQSGGRPPTEKRQKIRAFFSEHKWGGEKTFGFGKGWLLCICMYYPNTTGI